jgi:hypothetical protein
LICFTILIFLIILIIFPTPQPTQEASPPKTNDFSGRKNLSVFTPFSTDRRSHPHHAILGEMAALSIDDDQVNSSFQPLYRSYIRQLLRYCVKREKANECT